MEKKFRFERRKAIVFDLDGTIVKLNVNWRELKNLLSQRFYDLYGIQYEFRSITECLMKVLEKEDEKEFANLLDIIEQFELKNIAKGAYLEDTLFFIKNLELFNIPEGTKLAVLSLNMRKTIIKSLKNANICKKIDYIVGREDLRRWKPKPDGLLKIQEHFNLKSEDLIYFGDLQKDLDTGKNAGIDAFLIDELIHHVNEKRSNFK
jgi:beta-phosphoglucomutase-like phosphatase (HAD superfamily)